MRNTYIEINGEIFYTTGMKKVSIYIPESVRLQETSISFEINAQNVADFTAEKIVALTGGVSSFEVKGYYKRKDNGQVEVEKNIVLYTFTENPDDIKTIQLWAKEIAQEFNQECVLVTIEDVQAKFIEP